jgi:uncharacterized protein (TIGR02996 family)
MDERGGFVRAICAEPDEDTPRLAFADWLDEHGGGDRAEFIRLQCELGRLHEPELKTFTPIGVTDPDEIVRRQCVACSRGADCRFHVLERRIKALWSKGTDAGGFLEIPAGWGVPYWHRGFIRDTELPAAAFLEHAEAVFRAHPVTSVRLTDRRSAQWSTSHPQNLKGMWFWYDAGDHRGVSIHQHHVPRELCPLPEGLRPKDNHLQTAAYFATEAEADAALSRRCVAYGRFRAGFPPSNFPSVTDGSPPVACR